MTDPNSPIPTETPNVVITDPKVRKKWNTILSITLLVVGLISLFFSVFPEAAFGTDIPARAVGFVTSAVMIISAWFGLGVTNRNYPTR